MSYSYLIVGSVEILGTVMLKGPLLFGFPASELVSQCSPPNSMASARIVPAHVFSLVACMALPQEEGFTPVAHAPGSSTPEQSAQGRTDSVRSIWVMLPWR